ncbi:L-ribulose-5-phosphate 3-epimerase [Lacticaseibacillus paracasei]|uniref:L-ribulose-5-phosphate 3-epimerase n=1 Tax=Lacticaseibacillus paracasei TaxID=1597 RepID=UPI002874B53D|nr:L-ribulose-5-phosphate 3-epimerase [Lacticaseibacillus paracasei]MDS0491318.1 L-ribulose-5-phosphate 3-epimerase [Lacticaseibacillus paracasei]
MVTNALGIYEKALPENITWAQCFKLVRELGFNFFELSIDETDARISRLNWTEAQRNEVRCAMQKFHIRINTLMLSAHRKYPLGSHDPKIRMKSLEIMQKAIDLAVDLGIRNIQIAGYDVYYESKDLMTRAKFIEGLTTCVAMAAKKLVMLSVETMDDSFLNSMKKIVEIKRQIPSPWLQIYPDIGNISAWPENNVAVELEKYISLVAAIHLKDTIMVSDSTPGQFRNVPFGKGDVDFQGCLETLKRLGYAGSYTIEMWSEDEKNAIQNTRNAKRYFDSIFAKIGILQEPLIGEK